MRRLRLLGIDHAAPGIAFQLGELVAIDGKIVGAPAGRR
jgi:hypothetical protein